MNEVGDIQDVDGFEWVCTAIEGGISVWKRRDRVRIEYEVVD